MSWPFYVERERKHEKFVIIVEHKIAECRRLDRLENFYCLILSSSDEKNEKSFIKVKHFLFLTKKKQKIERFLESPLSPFTKFQTEHYKLWESLVRSSSLKVWKFYCVFNLFSFIVSSTPSFSNSQL